MNQDLVQEERERSKEDRTQEQNNLTRDQEDLTKGQESQPHFLENMTQSLEFFPLFHPTQENHNQERSVSHVHLTNPFIDPSPFSNCPSPSEASSRSRSES